MNNTSTSLTGNETSLTWENLDKAMKQLQEISMPKPEVKIAQSVPPGCIWFFGHSVDEDTGMIFLMPCEFKDADYMYMHPSTFEKLNQEANNNEPS